MVFLKSRHSGEGLSPYPLDPFDPAEAGLDPGLHRSYEK